MKILFVLIVVASMAFLWYEDSSKKQAQIADLTQECDLLKQQLAQAAVARPAVSSSNWFQQKLREQAALDPAVRSHPTAPHY